MGNDFYNQNKIILLRGPYLRPTFNIIRPIFISPPYVPFLHIANDKFRRSSL